MVQRTGSTKPLLLCTLVPLPKILPSSSVLWGYLLQEAFAKTGSGCFSGTL